jgi:flagellin
VVQALNTNMAALMVQRQLDKSQHSMLKSMQRLSSGLRINSAKDDPAGLAIAERMSAKIRGMNQARRNANDAISMAQTNEGSLSQQIDILQRIRELAVQSINGSLRDSDRQAIQIEAAQLISALDQLAQSSDQNNQTYSHGARSRNIYQIGPNAGDVIELSATNWLENTRSILQLDLSSAAKAQQALAMSDEVMQGLNTERSKLGAFQNRLEFTLAYLDNSIANSSAARSRIMDADFAAETASLARSQILIQAGMAMLTIANSMPNLVLSLLKTPRR